MIKTFICLANSRKHSGKCVVGKTIDTYQTIRPISDRENEELSEIEIRYSNGQLPKILDIISIKTKGSRPNNYQKENWLIDKDYYWKFEKKYDFDNLSLFCDSYSAFWQNTESSYNGKNDRISSQFFSQISKSFLLLELHNSSIIIREEGREFGNPKRKVRFQFFLNNVEYVLPVTHPEIERLYLGKPDGVYNINEVHYLSVSTGVPHEDGKIYLFAAGIIISGMY